MTENLVRRLIASAAAKPFLILTGNTGTGKTRLAKYLGEWLAGEDRCLVQPVGADWTDTRNVVGYYNSLRDRYESTPILNLVLDAQDDPEHPYFLVLDEMNLSRVEYYFADFLSAMESGREIPLHERSEEISTESGDGGRPIPRRLEEVPANLFVLGTVNVDETTNMFSPKVLDRANVIELALSSQEFSDFISGDGIPVGAGLEDVETSERRGQEFLNLSYAVRGREEAPADIPNLPDEGGGQFREAFESVFRLMEYKDLQFGYRTGTEALRYARVASCLSGQSWDWETAFDDQMVQKVLPKLHGGRDKLLELLVALGRFFATGDFDDAEEVFDSDVDPNSHLSWEDDDSPVFEKSRDKTAELRQELSQNRFASFL